jgi:hypothetical protein
MRCGNPLSTVPRANSYVQCALTASGCQAWRRPAMKRLSFENRFLARSRGRGRDGPTPTLTCPPTRSRGIFRTGSSVIKSSRSTSGAKATTRLVTAGWPPRRTGVEACPDAVLRPNSGIRRLTSIGPTTAMCRFTAPLSQVFRPPIFGLGSRQGSLRADVPKIANQVTGVRMCVAGLKAVASGIRPTGESGVLWGRARFGSKSWPGCPRDPRPPLSVGADRP